jgi:hypothetical protein
VASFVVEPEPAVESPVAQPEPAVARPVVEPKSAVASPPRLAELPAEAHPAEEPLEIDVHVSPEPPAAHAPRVNEEAGSDDASVSTHEPENLCTPLEPIMRRVRERESMLPADEGHTPYLGTRDGSRGRQQDVGHRR